MIAQLRRKIVWMTVGVLFLLVLLANMVTHLSVVYTCGQLTEQLLAVLAESDEGVRGESQIKLEKGPLLGTLILDKEALVALTNTPLYGRGAGPGGTAPRSDGFSGGGGISGGSGSGKSDPPGGAAGRRRR